MSAVIALKTSDFSLLITDTRLVRYTKERKMEYIDSAIKIQYIDRCGFLAGVGVSELSYGMYNKIKNIKIDTIRPTLLWAFSESYNELNKTANCADSAWLKKTGICVTWIDDVPQLRVFSNSDHNNKYRDLKVNSPMILYPDDLTDDLKKSIQERLESISGNLNLQLRFLLNAFKEISVASAYVSSIACIGIIFPEAEPIFYKDEVEQLLSSLQKNTLLDNQFQSNKGQLTAGSLPEIWPCDVC